MIQSGYGGPEALALTRLPDPVPASDDVVIQVTACALNRLDALQLAGPAIIPGFALPHIGGMDIGGEIVAVGSNVTHVRLGDRVVVDPAVCCGTCMNCRNGMDGYCVRLRVIGGNAPGGFAQLTSVPASAVHKAPEGLSLDDAVALPTAWSIAWHATRCVAAVQPGEFTVVTGAAGAVGSAVVQLASHAGARVIALASSPRKRALATTLGAEKACAIASAADLVRDQTNGRGADLVLDCTGATTWDIGSDCLRLGGRIVTFGNVGGDRVTLSLARLYHRGIRILGAGAYCGTDFRAVLGAFVGHGLRVVRGSAYPLAKLPVAYSTMLSRDQIGKVVVVP